MEPGHEWTGRRVGPENWKFLLEEATDGLFDHDPGKRSINALEIGCGGGGRPTQVLCQRLALRYGALAVRFWTLDIAMEKVTEAARRLSIESIGGLYVLRGDFYQFPFADQTFDYLIALNVFFWAKKKQLLSEAARILKPGGRFLIHDVLPRPSERQRPLISFVLSREQILSYPSER